MSPYFTSPSHYPINPNLFLMTKSIALRLPLQFPPLFLSSTSSSMESRNSFPLKPSISLSPTLFSSISSYISPTTSHSFSSLSSSSSPLFLSSRLPLPSLSPFPSTYSSSSSSSSSPLHFPFPYRNYFSSPTAKSLNSLISVSEILSRDPPLAADEISNIWISHLKDKEILSSPTTPSSSSSSSSVILWSLPKNHFVSLRKNSQKFPFCVFPNFKSAGVGQSEFSVTSQHSQHTFEMFLFNFQFPNFLLTSLHEYRMKGDHSSPFGVFTSYDEFLSTHSLALLRGEITQTTITKDEISNLLTLSQLFYNGEDSVAMKFVENFNKNSQQFHFEEFVAYCKKVTETETFKNTRKTFQ